ncbi:putative receptor-like protein kinase At3g47110 [Lactuca sativa]|uniref:non-specific serine/threonine protein kinase n=1 Tax=Lactuca sativa TaxID=4236 RepID=A0A9R1WE53_LACSA|nr:putative receptor-like protein kinase At3g47110 [Lactuca sativa]KAJ0222178.1 hypothetical protein LSAT_V11C200069560 [Lactuca sativa]
MCFSFFSKVAVLFVALIIQMSGVVSVDNLALHAIKSEITEDPQGVLKFWNDSLPFCLWRGVICGSRHQRVTGLNLANRGLVGTLSPSIGNLSFLRYIYLDNNKLHGSIPSEIGSLFRLESLSLPNNSFAKEIPNNISNCTKLQHIDLSGNMLSGNIPNIFSSLGMIQEINFWKNKLTGGIPTSIGNLTYLEFINLSGCRLEGSIPDSFHQLTNLRSLILGENRLVGNFPMFIFNLSKIEVLNFPDNQLAGSLPSNLCSNQPHLQRLEFGQTLFTGVLPPSLSNCSQLRRFDSTYNNFKGEINVDFGKLRHLWWLTLGPTEGLGGMKYFDSLLNCSNLELLELAGLQLRGIPDWVGNLTELRTLKFQYTSISGTLPSSIGNLHRLTVLSLVGNKLTGMIPESIGKLSNLAYLNLGFNSFSGIIPRSIGNLSSLIEISFRENKLEGTIPSSIGACKELIFLSFALNNLIGTIPKEVFQLSSLSKALDLSVNNLSGVLPPGIHRLKNLDLFDLSMNHLSGEIPSSLSSCISLGLLDFSSNSFHGSMPEAWRSLKGLKYLNLSRNNISGPIPSYLEQIPLEYLDLSYNDFEGEVYVKGVFTNTSVVSVQGNPRLCGGIAELHLAKCTSIVSNKSKKLSLGGILAISLSSVAACVALVFFVLVYFCVKKKKDTPTESILIRESFEMFSYERLFKATDGFSSQNLIGTGSFASVYKGVLDEEGTIVAIKVLNLQRRGGSKSFIAECEALRNIRHRNLVKIITACSTLNFQGNDFKALVYDFMPNGSLERLLHSCTILDHMPPHHSCQLDLIQRISIAKDVACALDYLHNHCGNVVVHCDLKPSNILLDVDMVAHIGDFGLAKILTLDQLPNANMSSSSLISGTIGYAAPEYGLGNGVSPEGDIYSYGILLLEMVTGKRPIDLMFQEGLSLHSYARKALADGFLLQIVDPMLLNDDVNEVFLSSLAKIGVQCSYESPHDRMDIGIVIHELLSVMGTASSMSTDKVGVSATQEASV